MNRAGARKQATIVPRPWASHCWFGGVRRRKPTRKSPTKSDAWLAPMLAIAPPSKLRRCASTGAQPSALVAPPRTTCEALEAAVKGVMSVTPQHWMARKEKTNARRTESKLMPTGMSYWTPMTTQMRTMTRTSIGAHIQTLTISSGLAGSSTRSSCFCCERFSRYGWSTPFFLR